METKQKTPEIIQLMGKENKKQTKKTHRAIIVAFRNSAKGNGAHSDDGNSPAKT